MRIRLAEPARRHARLQASVEAGVLEVLRSGRHVGGPAVERLEGALAASWGLSHGVGLGSGTEALQLGLEALELPAGSRVALPALSFFATTEAVLRAGHAPVFVDVLPDRPLMDAAQVPEDVAAVVLVHLFGMRSPCPELGVPVLSDAAQCAGWGHGAPPGVASTLSFYPSKTLAAAGDGGMLLTDDGALAARVRALGWHGQSAPNVHRRLGCTSRLDPVQAAVIQAQLGGLHEAVRARRALADRYDERVAGLPREAGDAVHQYVLLSDRRDELAAELEAAGVDVGRYYPLPMDAQPVVGGSGTLEGSACPNAVAFCRASLALPVHEDLRPDEVERILAVLS